MNSKKNYSIITEHPKSFVTQEQLVRAFTRYTFASKYCEGKTVLELASGGGQGLGILGNVAEFIIGSDVDKKNISVINSIRTSIKGCVSIMYTGGENIAVKSGTIDCIVFFEAIYYINDVNKLLQECKRVLKSDGALIICTANPEWSDFNPSAFSISYYPARKLYELLQNAGFTTKLYYSDKIEHLNVSKRLVSITKRIAIKLHLIPRSMKFKKIFKRIFIGNMVEMPICLNADLFPYQHPCRLDPFHYDPEFKVLYAIGKVKNT